MRLVPFLGVCLLSFASFAAHAQGEADAAVPAVIGDCSPPAAPSVPDGATAAASELKAASAEVKSFVAAGEDYTLCLDDHEEAQGDEISQEEAAALVQSHNAMVESMQAVAADFNTALEEYRARKKAEKEGAAE